MRQQLYLRELLSVLWIKVTHSSDAFGLVAIFSKATKNNVNEAPVTTKVSDQIWEPMGLGSLLWPKNKCLKIIFVYVFLPTRI